MTYPIGALQGRLTPSDGRGIQFFPYDAWEAEFHTAKKIGLDCIEFLIQRKDWGNLEHPLLTPEGRDALRAVAEETGVGVPSVHAYYEPRETFPEELATIASAAKTR